MVALQRMTGFSFRGIERVLGWIMILGIGIDIVEISSFDQAVVKEAFIKKVFTPKEIEECRAGGKTAELFAQKFALKEAFMKAIGAGIGQEVWFTNIEVLRIGQQVQIAPHKKAKKYYEVILRETERLTSLIDNVLNISRIERGKGAYAFKETDVAQAVEHGVEIYRHRLEKSGLKLEYKVDNLLPPVRADEHAITLAVVNLIDNVTKYAKGTDVVGVELSQVDGFIHIDVYDTGVGISMNQVKRVFERFYRVPSEETRKQRGSGIGLNLVKHIAEEHGGDITVTSEPNIETRFTIRIPMVTNQS